MRREDHALPPDALTKIPTPNRDEDQSSDGRELEVEELDGEETRVPIVELAVAYARAGMRVLPVDMRIGSDGKRSKGPLPGYRWKQRATTVVAHVVEDMLDAIRLIGEANVGIGWALGLDGCLALDLDVDVELAPAWWEELPLTATNKTARGVHLIYRAPVGRVIGNGTGRFPATGWGEVRGAGGYVVVAGPDRPGFEVADLDLVAPFPHPEWLSDAGAEALVVSVAELEAVIAAHPTGTHPAWIRGYRTDLEAWTVGESRHDVGYRVACWIWREILADVVPAVPALEVLVEWWQSVAGTKPRRLGDRELASIIRDSLGAVLAEPERLAEVAAKANGYDAATEVSSMSELLAGFSSSAGDGEELEGEEASTWTADVALVGGDGDRPIPTILRRSDLDGDGALFYVGMVNGVHGDSGVGKGWVVLSAIKSELVAGNRVIYLDLEDVAASIYARLRTLRVDDDVIDRLLAYRRPTEPLTAADVAALVAEVRTAGVSLVVLDSLGQAFGLEGINEDKDAEVGPFLRNKLRPIAEAGAAVLVIDHATKAADNPLHPSGSKRKRADVSAAYLVEALHPLSATDGGTLRLTCAKDRHGSYRKGEVVTKLIMSVYDGATSVRFDVPVGGDAVSLPSILAARAAVATCKAAGRPLTKNQLTADMAIKGRPQVKSAGIDYAVEVGAIEVTSGPRNSLMHTYVRDLLNDELELGGSS